MNEDAAKGGQDWGRWLTAAGVLLVLGFVGLIAGGWIGVSLGTLADESNHRPGLEGYANSIFGMLGGAALGAILGAALTPGALRWLYKGSWPTSGRGEDTADVLAQPPAPSANEGARPDPSPAKQKMQLAAANLCLLVVLSKIGSDMGASLGSAIARAPALKNGLDFWLFGMGYNLVEYSQWAGTLAGIAAGIMASKHYKRRQSRLNSNP